MFLPLALTTQGPEIGAAGGWRRQRHGQGHKGPLKLVFELSHPDPVYSAQA